MNDLDSIESKFLIQTRYDRNIIVGVPHHAPVGVDKLPCGRYSDENTGYLGQYLAEKLRCCSIIACNYTIDVNKSMDNEYVQQVLQWDPKVYVEIHGHKRKRSKNDIEITCGSLERNEYSLTLAEKLQEKCRNDNELKWLKICGDFETIFFKARTAKTMQHNGWLGILLELPPELRYIKGQKGGQPPKIGYKFCDYLVESLTSIQN